METGCASRSKAAFKPGKQSSLSSRQSWKGQAVLAAGGSLFSPGIEDPEPQEL